MYSVPPAKKQKQKQKKKNCSSTNVFARRAHAVYTSQGLIPVVGGYSRGNKLEVQEEEEEEEEEKPRSKAQLVPQYVLYVHTYIHM